MDSSLAGLQLLTMSAAGPTGLTWGSPACSRTGSCAGMTSSAGPAAQKRCRPPEGSSQQFRRHATFWAGQRYGRFQVIVARSAGGQGDRGCREDPFAGLAGLVRVDFPRDALSERHGSVKATSTRAEAVCRAAGAWPKFLRTQWALEPRTSIHRSSEKMQDAHSASVRQVRCRSLIGAYAFSPLRPPMPLTGFPGRRCLSFSA